jgi:O-methyltransferase involved in polyketide biosynthesis
MGRARFEGDTRDLASSIGVTATMVAPARAVAARSPNPLINDQFPEPRVRGVGVDDAPFGGVVYLSSARKKG